MIRFLLSIIFISVVTTFISCDGQNETSQNLPGSKDSAGILSVSTEEGLSKDSADSYRDEPVAAPVVIRSAVPHYGYQPDTNQVSQYIRCIFQDTKGNLWFGTVGDGVCKYDGKSLTYYTTGDGFSGNSVQSIVEDKSGSTWFGTIGGLSKYDPSQQSKTNGSAFINFTEKEGLSNNQVLSLLIDRSGIMWVGTNEGVFRSNPSSLRAGEKTFAGFLTPLSSPKGVKSMTEDRAGNTWFAASGGIVFRYDGNTLTNVSEKAGLSDHFVHCILQDRTGGIWFATQNKGVIRYDPSAEFSTPGARAFTSFTTKEGLGNNETWKLYEDKAGNLWVASRGSVCRYNPSASRGNGRKPFTAFRAEYGLTNCCVQSIFEDRSGNLWFGSGAGLFRFDRSRESHPCNQNSCKHDLQIQQDLKEHNRELAKTFINVTKKGPWPKHFR